MRLSTAQNSKEPFYNGSIMFVEFFDAKYLQATGKYIMVIPTCLHCVQVKHLMRKNQRIGA